MLKEQCEVLILWFIRQEEEKMKNAAWYEAHHFGG
jgi:hypothetical protein